MAEATVTRKHINIPMEETLNNRKLCKMMAKEIAANKSITGMTESQLSREIFAHAYVFYNFRFVPKKLSKTDLFKKILRSASDGVDLEDGGDSLIRRIAYRMIWLMPAFPIN